MPTSVTNEQLRALAKAEAEVRQVDLEIIQLKADLGITQRERELGVLRSKAETMRNDLLTQQAEFVAVNGKKGSGEYVQIRQKNTWDYNEEALLPKLKADPRFKPYVVVTTTERIDKNEFKKQLARLGLDELTELGVKYVEGYSTDFRPLGDLEELPE